MVTSGQPSLLRHSWPQRRAVLLTASQPGVLSCSHLSPPRLSANALPSNIPRIRPLLNPLPNSCPGPPTCISSWLWPSSPSGLPAPAQMPQSVLQQKQSDADSMDVSPPLPLLRNFPRPHLRVKLRHTNPGLPPACSRLLPNHVASWLSPSQPASDTVLAVPSDWNVLHTCRTRHAPSPALGLLPGEHLSDQPLETWSPLLGTSSPFPAQSIPLGLSAV